MPADWTSEKIKELVVNEFGSLGQVFSFASLPVIHAFASRDQQLHRPGVYIYFGTDGIFKVGRSLQNALKRASQHISANTGGQMANLAARRGSEIMLITVNDQNDIHWVCALEVFLEMKLAPIVRSQRIA